MIKLIQLLLEAPMDDKTAKQIVTQGQRLSIWYKDPETNKGAWSTVVPIKSDEVNGEKVIIANVLTGGVKPKPKTFIQSRITNWMISSPKTYDKIADAIVNKRVVTITYKGEDEKSVGTRMKVKPVCYGITRGKYYLRAWQETGATETKVPAWKFFRVDRISSWEVDGTETFTTEPGANYNETGDEHIDKIIAMADFKPGEAPEPIPVIKPTPVKPADKKKPKDTKKPDIGTSSTSTPSASKPKEEPPKAKPKKQQYASTRTKKDDKAGEDLKEALMIKAIREAIEIF